MFFTIDSPPSDLGDVTDGEELGRRRSAV